MADANQTNSKPEQGSPAKSTHSINGAGNKRQGNQNQNQNQNNQQNNDVQFYPDEATAMEGTSKYSSAVIERSYKLKAMELQRANHRHTSYVGAIIHQLENATQAKYREKHIDLVREAILNVKDKLDELEMHIDSETTRIEGLIEGNESEHKISAYSNVIEYTDVPIQTVSALKWVDLLEKADKLIELYDKGLFAPRCNIDPIERADLVNNLVKMFNVFPNYVNKQNKNVADRAKEIAAQNGSKQT